MVTHVKASMMEALRKIAVRLPGTEEGIACKGTALESRTFKLRKKAFLFLRTTEGRLKLDESIQEATALSAQVPEHCSVGAQGWVLVRFEGNSIPMNVLERWVKESHRLYANDEASKANRSRPKVPKTKKKAASGR